MHNVHLRQSWCKVGLAALLALGTIPAAGLSAVGQAWAAEAEVVPAAVTATAEGPETAIGEAESAANVAGQTPADAAPPRDAAPAVVDAADASVNAVPADAPAQPQKPTLPALTSGWNDLDGQWYYGGADGTPQTGWLYDGGWYYLNPANQGAMARGWTQVDGAWYYLNWSGVMETGWQLIDGAWHYLAPNGERAHGWQWIGGAWYYLYPDTGAMAMGWNQIDGTWYFLNWSGVMQTGWQNQGGTWYYLFGSGAMATGWQWIGGAWYYLYPDTGAMATYWTQIDGTWYYLNGSGAMKTGWLNLGGTWYYLAGSGAMQTGWQWIGGAWYYLYPDTGAMATGWLQLGDDWYYLGNSGAMATGSVTIGNEYHQFDGAGVWQGSTDLAGMFTAWAQPEWSATNWLILVDTARCKVAVFWGSQWNWQLQHLWDCSPGKASTPTVKGRFSVGSRGYYFDSKNARCFYYTQFYGNYLFHSVLYHQTSSPTWIMDGRLGIPLSHGCVRLDVWNAQWIYNNIPSNTRVYVW